MKYLTLKQTAEKFGMCTKTIARLAKDKKIPCTHATGSLRFPEEELDKWARAPELVTARWFSGKIDDDDPTDCEERPMTDGDKEREDMGRALFLQKREGQA